MRSFHNMPRARLHDVPFEFVEAVIEKGIHGGEQLFTFANSLSHLQIAEKR